MAAPRTWDPNYVVTSTDLNTEVRDQLNKAFAPNLTKQLYVPASNYTITGGTGWGNVDGSNLSKTVTVDARTRLLLVANFMFYNSTPAGSGYGAVDIAVDGTRVGDTNYGLFMRDSTGGQPMPVTLLYVATGLAAGSRTFTLQFKTSNASYTSTIYGTFPITFLAVEI